jgi:hypothetical protein
MFDRTIPIGMHGDAGGFTEHESLIVLSWNSLLGSGSTRSKRFLFTVLLKKECTRATLDAVFKIFAWCVNSMLTGIMPTEDWDEKDVPGGGVKMAEGWRACLTHCRGDWQWYNEIFDFPAWNTNNRMCWMCLASSVIAGLLYTDCSRQAGRRHTHFTHQSYLAYLADHNLVLPTLLALCIGFRLECILVDVLHAADLGMTAHIIGNILWETVRNHSWGGSTQEDNVALLAKDLASWYKTTKCKVRLQGKLTKERIRADGKFPKLKAKGAAARYLVEYCLHLARRFSTGSDHDELKIALVEKLVRLYQIMAENGQFFAPAVQREFAKIGQDISKMLSVLAAEAHALGQRLWQYSPKVHLVEHMTGEQAATFGNPRYYWCYPDEDLVGLSVEVAENCHVKTMAEMVILKWLILAFDNDNEEP